MALIYRAMLKDGDKPQVSSKKNVLGVRVPPDKPFDIPVEPNGKVQPGTGDLSVAAAWRKLPFFLIPRRLKHEVPAAAGNNSLVCWRLGDGPFAAGPVAPGLWLRPDPTNANHGVVEPDQPMLLADYQAAIAATRDQWEVDEG